MSRSGQVEMCRGVFREDTVQNGVLDSRLWRAAGFHADSGQSIVQDVEGVPNLLVGLGPANELTVRELRRATMIAGRRLGDSAQFGVDLESFAALPLARELVDRTVAEGFLLGGYSFTASADKGGSRSPNLTPSIFSSGWQLGVKSAEAVMHARDIVNLPPNLMTPAIFVQKARELLVGTSVSVSEIAGDALTSGRFGGIQGVGSGSRNAPRLLELRFGPAVNPDITLVGKGITFDSGGISIKSSDALMSMKNDVSGAAAVLGAMTLAPIVAPTLTIHAIIPLAENMPDGAAMRPGDVIEVRDGSTIEVLNTDFEGRLVLADGIAYASESSPRRVLDIASLTYAAINALGTDMAALLGNDESFLKDLERSAVSSGEDVWRMPLNSRLRGQILSEIADFKNFPGSPYARSITAALLLREFVGAGILWAHLDISGPCWLETSDNASVAGGTGYGVRLIAEVLATYEAMNHSTES